MLSDGPCKSVRSAVFCFHVDANNILFFEHGSVSYEDVPMLAIFASGLYRMMLNSHKVEVTHVKGQRTVSALFLGPPLDLRISG